MATIQEVFEEKNNRKKAPLSYETWRQDPTPSNLRTVVKELEPTIKHAVKQYAGPSYSPTVEQRARLLAADAVRAYDPSKGAALPTYVQSQLRSIQRMAPVIADPFPPAERFRREQTKIREAEAQLEDMLGHDPSDEEVAEQTGIRLSRIKKIRSRMRARMPLSVYEDSQDDDDKPDIVGEEYDEFDDWMDAVYQGLGSKDKFIFMHRTGYRNADVLTNNEIANRLNMSAAAVSQRANRIQRKLDEFHG